MRDIICPVCKGDCIDFFFDVNGDICGCDRCVSKRDAYEYLAEQDELEADYAREMFMSDK